MKQCKITVLKTHFDAQLAAQYGDVGIGPCPCHSVGQVYFSDNRKPEGFCDEAWKAIYQYVFALVHGIQEPFYGGGWIGRPGIAVCSCNDGLRPVIFKLEAMESD